MRLLFIAWILISLVLIAALSACGPVTVKSLKERPVGTLSFEVAQPYQDVYHKILQQARVCYLNKPIDEQIIIRDRRINKDKTANITLAYVYALKPEQVFMTIDTIFLDENRTSVKIWHASRQYKKQVAAIPQWVEDGSAKCVS